MLPFEDYVHARGAGLVQLGYALSGNPHTARELALEALVRARRHWPKIQEQPDEPVEQELVQAYLAWWRRPLKPRADHPLATLSRAERAVLVLRLWKGLAEARIADTIGRSGTTVRRILEAHEGDKDGLQEFVDTLMPPNGLVERVDAKARTLKRRRVLVGFVAVAALATVAVIGATRPGKPEVRKTPDAVPSSFAPVPMRLVPAAFSLPAFPYEPTYLPRDPGPPAVYKTTHDLVLEYVDISLVLSPNEPPIEGTPELLEIDGVAARLFSFPTANRLDLTLVWHPERQWLRLHTFGLTREDVLRIANGLRPGNVPMTPPPFELTRTPDTFSLQTASSDRLCVGPGSDLTTGPFGVCVQLTDSDGLEALPATRVQRTTIGGRRVDLVDYPSRQSELRLYLGDGRALVITQNALTMGTKLSADDMVSFAASIRLFTPP